MATVKYQDAHYVIPPCETLLQALEQAGVQVPRGCRAGVCHNCLMQAVEGTPPAEAQTGLKETLRAQGYFLPCRARPKTDLTVRFPAGEADRTALTRVSQLEALSSSVLRVRLRTERPFAYRPGQFITVVRSDGLQRSYSLASLPDADAELELHVRRVPGGAMSGWMHQSLACGQELAIVGPFGQCFYVPGCPEQPLLLVGTGTGLAPLYGILRDALRHGHRGPVHLYHGAVNSAGLYLDEALRALQREHPHFSYTPCVRDGQAGEGPRLGAVDQIALQAHQDLKGWRVFLCGDPGLVLALRKKAYLAGAALADIHADAFEPAHPAAA